MPFAAQKRTYQDTDQDDIDLLTREGTLPKISSSGTTSCYQSAEASTFLIRGKHYLQDRKKVSLISTLNITCFLVFFGLDFEDLLV